MESVSKISLRKRSIRGGRKKTARSGQKLGLADSKSSRLDFLDKFNPIY